MREDVASQTQDQLSISQRSFHGDDRNSVIIHQRGGAGVENTDVIPIKSVCL